MVKSSDLMLEKMADGTCCAVCGEPLGRTGEGFPVCCTGCSNDIGADIQPRPKHSAAGIKPEHKKVKTG